MKVYSIATNAPEQPKAEKKPAKPKASKDEQE